MSLFQDNLSFILVSYGKINFHNFMMQRLCIFVLVPTLSSDPGVRQHKESRDKNE